MNRVAINITLSLLVISFIVAITLLLVDEHSTRIIWTVALPLLPLFIVLIGYANWREVCPLAFFSKISQKINIFPKRKVPVWFEHNFYLLQYFFLFAGFSSRLVTLNFSASSVAFFLIYIISIAFLINLIFTGKSWCNFFCPISVVEKIYCVSNAKNYNQNSACATCSACKTNCPDIDMESNYWKENSNWQKTFVVYSFSGLVFGFYFYFYLQGGSWEHYFSGEWTHEHLTMFSSGFYFAPQVPILVAAPLTLIVSSLISYFIFRALENYLYKYQVFGKMSLSTIKHRIKVIAAFTAFNIFYVFAGAPTYQHYPVAYAIFYFIIVVVSSLILHKEFFRKEGYFVQERFALKVLQKWDSSQPLPSNLKEIYYTYVNRSKNRTDVLNTYKETLVDLLYDGVLTQESMVLLEKLRSQMGISEKDHLNVMKSIKLKNEDLFNKNINKSSEKVYQRNSYKRTIEDALNSRIELNYLYLKSLRKQFQITDATHHEIMNEILDTNKKLHNEVIQLLKKMNALRRVHKSIIMDDSREIPFLKYVIRNEFSLISKELFILLNLIYEDNIKELEALKEIFRYKNVGKSFSLKRTELEFMDEKIANEIFQLKKDFDNTKNAKEVSQNQNIIKYLLTLDSYPITSAALLVGMNYDIDYTADPNFEKFLNCPNKFTSELANKIFYKTNNITTYDKMVHLYHVPLFRGIKLNYLKVVAQATLLEWYGKDQYIIRQGEPGDSLMIIIKGSVQTEVDGVPTDTLGDEDYFGAIALLGDITRQASIKTLEHVEILRLSKNALTDVIYENPKFSIKLMKEIIQRLTTDKQQCS